MTAIEQTIEQELYRSFESQLVPVPHPVDRTDMTANYKLKSVLIRYRYGT